MLAVLVGFGGGDETVDTGSLEALEFIVEL